MVLVVGSESPQGVKESRSPKTSKWYCTDSWALTPSVQKQQQLFGEDLDIGVFAQGGHDDVLVGR